MWVLKKLTDDAAIQYLITEKKCYTVGRKNSDIMLNDDSISRSHCTINIAPKNECPFTVQTQTGVWVIDKKSKYGTYIQKNHEWVRIEAETVEELSHRSVIRFGLMRNVWMLEYIPVIACTSRLSTEQTQELKSQLSIVDGKLLSKWANQCTVVVVNDITLTIKVLLALIHGIPIVTRNYLTQLIENVRQNQPLPDCKNYKPEITESTLASNLVSLNPEDNRRELFKGKTFVIPMEEQFESLREIIEAAGGCAQLLKLDGNWRKLADENMVVVQLPINKINNPDKSAKAFKNLTNVLKTEYHVRAVPETEIYHAIAYSSIEKYCNPKSQAFELRHGSCNQNSCGDIIEEETPAENHDAENFQQPTTSGVKEPNRLPCSDEDVTPSRKRGHSPEIEKSAKRTALDSLVSNADLMGISGDADMFGDISNGGQDKPAEEGAKEDGILNNFEDLKITKRDSAKDEKGIGGENSGKKQPVDLHYSLGDFWDYNPESSTSKSGRKRKLSGDSTEKNSLEKRKCVETAKKTSRNAGSVEEKSIQDGDERSPPTSSIHISKKTPNISRQPKHVSLSDIGNDSSWHRRKNAKECTMESVAPVEVIVNVKTFKKKERYIPQASVDDRTEEIGKKLLMRGWHMSHCSTRRA